MRVLSALPFVNLHLVHRGLEQLNAYGSRHGHVRRPTHVLPRMVGDGYLRGWMARAHFWLAAVGILLVVVPEALAGVTQGFQLRDPSIPFLTIAKGTLPFLRVNTHGGIVPCPGPSSGEIWRFIAARPLLACATMTASLFKPVDRNSCFSLHRFE